MAKSGRIEAADLLDEKAILVFQQLENQLAETNAELKKLRDNNIKLGKTVSTSQSQSLKVQAAIKKNLAQINKLSQQRIDLELKGISLQQKAKALRQQELKQLTLLQKSYRELQNIAFRVGAAIAIFNTVKNAFSRLQDIILKIDSFNNLMEKTTGTVYGASDSMKYLIATSKQFGVSLEQSIQRYSKFYAAATQAGLAAEDIRDIFSGLANVSGNLGLRSDELSGVFLAIEQMLSKGKVTTEELRRQLGERMPGAVGIMVRALNKLNPELKITTNDLDEMLKKGEVISAEVLPEFVRQAQEAFGVLGSLRTDTLVADMERMNTAWVELVYTIENGNGIIGEAMSTLFNSIQTGLETLTYNNKVQSIMTSNERWGASTYQLALDLAKSIPAFHLWAQARQEAFDRSLKATADLVDEMREYDDLFASVLKLRIEGALLADVELDSEEELLKIRQLSKEQLIAEIDLLTKRNKLAADTKELVKYTIEWWNAEKDAAKAVLETVTSTDAMTESAIAARARIAEADAAIELILGKVKKTRTPAAKKEFQLEFVNPETIGGLKTTVSLLQKLADEQSNMSVAASYREKAQLIQAEIDLLEQKITLEEHLKNISKEKPEEDELFDFTTFDTALRGIGSAIAPNDGGFQAQMNIWIEEYKKFYGADISNWESFLEEKLSAHIDFQKEAAEINKKTVEEQAQATQEIIQAAQAVIGSLFDYVDAIYNRKLENIEAEIRAEEDKYDRLLELAKDDKDAQEDLNREKADSLRKLEKEELKIKQRQAKYDKAKALFDIAMNTAVAISAAFIKPWQIAVVAALGAIQTAAVLAQPIPQYKHGRKDGPAELAVVGDGGKSEVVVSKRGTYSTPSKPTLTYLEKGDKVFSSFDAYQKWLSEGDVSGKGIEDAIKNGFEKAKINNYIKPAQVKVDLKHAAWYLKNTGF